MAATVATPLERALGRIAGVTEMTSSSSLGSTRITLQFDLSRDIDGAARDVQAAINAARTLLPSSLPNNPTYRKVNPADAPIMIIALTSDTMTRGQMYDAASTVLAQKLSQVEGIGQVSVGGSSLPAVRVELNPAVLNKYGISTAQVRATIQATNANKPKGALEDGDRHWQIGANDQAIVAAEYLPLIVAYVNGAAVRLSDVADVVDSVQDLRNDGSADGKRSVLLILNRQPGANIIETIERVRDVLPQLRASIPSAIDMKVMMDRTPTIRASLREVERTLFIAVALVILVVFLFLRNARAALIPSVAVPVSLIGTFGVMYLAGFSLNNLSLMALTVATGFVVDDAIVVLENVSRHIEEGMTPRKAALIGAREVGFTVVSMSLSLIAVFIPILLMGGIVGRLFREFAVTLSAAILVSLAVSLTTTPMMCSRLLRPATEYGRGRFAAWSERALAAVMNGYGRSLAWVLRHGLLTMLVLAATVGLNIYLYVIIPKGFFPQQDTGRLIGNIQADQGISFQAMQKKLATFVDTVRADPAVESVVAFTGGGQRNSGSMFVGLKPLSERRESADAVIGRLRGKLASEPGANLFLQSAQDIRIGGRQANAQYQFTLQADDLAELRQWEPRIRRALSDLPELADVNTDQQDKGAQTTLNVDRDTATRLGVTMANVDSTLNDVFGQRQVSTIYNPLNQYHVVMEAAPQYWQSPESLRDIYVSAASGASATPSTTGTSGASSATGATGSSSSSSAGNAAIPTASTGTAIASATAANVAGIATTAGNPQVPLSAFASYGPTNTPLAVNHQGQFAASTISFNLPEGISLSDATRVVNDTLARLGVPSSVHGTFQGTVRAFQASLDSQPWLILAALITVYIVLGVLYESYGIRSPSCRRCRRRALATAGAAGVQDRVQPDGADRCDPADRHREKERDHDDRLRARSGAQPQARATRCNIRRVLAALPPDHDDDACGNAGRAASRVGHRRRRGAAAAARHFDRRRSVREPTPHAVHDAGRLPLSRSVPPLGVAALAARNSGDACARRCTGAALMTTNRLSCVFYYLGAVAAALILAGCTVGPDYVKPDAPAPASYKEMPPAKTAAPADLVPRGHWWEVYGDATLNALIEQIPAANQTLRAAEANYRQSQAAVLAAQAGLYPTVGANISATRVRQANAGSAALYNLGVPVDWELDLWGKIRRTVEASQDSAEASAADLAATRLSLEAQLAQAYFALRVVDRSKRLSDETVAAYTRSLTLTQNRYDSGVAARSDVVQAETQLQSAQVQAIDIGVTRAQLEHAIAVLIGKAPADYALSPVEAVPALPPIPGAVPSELLERRPDIAAAERRVAAANAQIGVATAAFYPAVSLSGSIGFASSSFSNWISLPSRACRRRRARDAIVRPGCAKTARRSDRGIRRHRRRLSPNG